MFQKNRERSIDTCTRNSYEELERQDGNCTVGGALLTSNETDRKDFVRACDDLTVSKILAEISQIDETRARELLPPRVPYSRFCIHISCLVRESSCLKEAN